ncbi:MAG: transglycosylase SLT domain-containing protein [Bacteroidales bacterium]|nr:transglycosylase SLT domain-containing protein [Bacteroidales bacterium]
MARSSFITANIIPLPDLRSLFTNHILKEEAEKLGWDWRLIASMIYQESNFIPEAQSWVGAYGLMQMMPATMQKMGIDSSASPHQQIKAGVRYIKWLDNQFKPRIEDEEERKKFVLAAYNVGLAHVFDAIRLAEKYDKDPAVWNENVDWFLLNKSNPEFYQDSVVYYGYARGEEPYKYVNEIYSRYDHYRKIIE